VYGVCTLDVIAADVASTGAARGQDFLVATDARRREVYWARYDADGHRLDGPAVGYPADVAETAADRQDRPGILTAGAGALLYPGVLGEPIGPSYPAAATLARIAAQQLAAGLPGSGAEPIYLRRPDARVPGPPKRVTVP
jgi:tRNA threonylcarbamoyl adenosine modification protein YeaZ